MVNNHNILYCDNVKYLGVYFDSSLPLHQLQHLKSSSLYNLSSSLFPSNP